MQNPRRCVLCSKTIDVGDLRGEIICPNCVMPQDVRKMEPVSPNDCNGENHDEIKFYHMMAVDHLVPMAVEWAKQKNTKKEWSRCRTVINNFRKAFELNRLQ